MTQSITAIILAAGFSKRFGSLKLCANLANGHSVFGQTLERVSAAIPHPIVITRPEVAPLLAEFGAHIEVFEDAEQGMGATLAHSIGLVGNTAGCLICLADMPFITVSTYQQISTALRTDNIILPTYHSKPGNPVAFGHDFFGQLQELSGDSGGRTVVQHNQSAVITLPVTDAAILQDIDTPAELARYQALAGC